MLKRGNSSSGANSSYFRCVEWSDGSNGKTLLNVDSSALWHHPSHLARRLLARLRDTRAMFLKEASEDGDGALAAGLQYDELYGYALSVAAESGTAADALQVMEWMDQDGVSVLL